MVRQKIIRPSIKFFSSPSPCIQIKKILSIYLNHTNGWSYCVLRKSVCLIHINADISKSKLSPNSSIRDLLLKLFLRTNSANLTTSLVGILEVCSSNLLFNAKIPSLCGMLGYRLTTSAVTGKEPSGTFPILFILSIKSSESQMYDQPLCIKGFEWKSRNWCFLCWSFTVSDYGSSRYIIKPLMNIR